MNIQEKLKQFEMDFFKFEVFSNPEIIDNRISDEFIEIGKSGVKYSKKDVQEYFSNLNCDRLIEIEDFNCKKLSDEIVLVTYTSIEGNYKSYRTSIWIYKNDWKIIYHQGTALK